MNIDISAMNVNWFDHFFFTIIGIILPLMGLLTSRSTDVEEVTDEMSGQILPPKKHIYYTNGLLLVIGAMIVLTLWNINYRPFSTLGINYPIMDKMVVGLSILISIIYLADTLFNYYNSSKVKKQIEELINVMPTTWKDYKHFIFLALAAGICEEIIFRGFLINYIKELMGGSPYSNYMALIIPSVIFSISHIYQGWLAVIKIFFLSLLFGAIFILSKSLLIVIIIHVLVDLISGAVMVKVAQRLGF
ncbi:MAG: hypothetical protein RLZZ546_2177 [Bacteroidota bacterium]|jgi:membrane protease YdiL (CAAX protease family)